MRPLLFMDVDGPLIPFGGVGGHRSYQASRGNDENPLLARINPAFGPRLASLPCEMVWATSWMDDANECVSPRPGLPDLQVVTWPEPSAEDESDEPEGLHWKTRGLVEWAAGRSFAWVDDEITPTDRVWASSHHQGRALLHRVDPRTGLTESDFAVIDEWLRAES